MTIYKVEAENIVRTAAANAVDFLKSTEKKAFPFVDSLIVSVKCDWDTKRTSSRGGVYKKGPGINIAMAKYVHPEGTSNNSLFRFYEYKSYDADSVIGGFIARTQEEVLTAVTCHEVSHALQYYSYVNGFARCTPHGRLFKRIYTPLRKEFVNHKIGNQEELRKEYSRRVKHFVKQIMDTPLTI
jgi:hypothetical protein